MERLNALVHTYNNTPHPETARPARNGSLGFFVSDHQWNGHRDLKFTLTCYNHALKSGNWIKSCNLLVFKLPAERKNSNQGGTREISSCWMTVAERRSKFKYHNEASVILLVTERDSCLTVRVYIVLSLSSASKSFSMSSSLITWFRRFTVPCDVTMASFDRVAVDRFLRTHTHTFQHWPDNCRIKVRRSADLRFMYCIKKGLSHVTWG